MVRRRIGIRSRMCHPPITGLPTLAIDLKGSQQCSRSTPPHARGEEEIFENPAAGWIAINTIVTTKFDCTGFVDWTDQAIQPFAASSSKSKPSEQRNDEASATAGSRNRAGRHYAFLAPRF